MAQDKHENLRRLFDLVMELPAAERGDVLDRECGGDEGLRRRIEAMVEAAEDERFLSAPTGGVDPDATLERTAPVQGDQGATSGLRETAGSTIGPYKLLQQIGEGGFGSVFMAEQSEPVRRRVALKIIKLGMDTRHVVARFEQERQALAIMDHPNIAKVLDAGSTEAGRPFFVMELVKGDPITEYCDRQNLNIQSRIDLFAQVCHAVQHAHTKGIIHRDIKPSNILVGMQDGQPSVKVIDFGIAKATNATLTEKTLFTEHRQLIGTPAYMSPEQAEGSMDIDTRTDVYSLGVLLYELLTGSTPFDSKSLRSAAYAEIQRMIREIEPPRPSTRLSLDAQTIASVAAKRQSEPRKLGTIIRGELDWIVMKALEKDRTRRYETASALALDIQRYLAGEAVVAAPPSRSYRVRKFVRRNRSGVITATLIACTLVLGMIGTGYGMIRAERARAQEVKQSSIAEAQEQVAIKQANLALSSMQFVLSEVDSALKAQPGTNELRIAILESVSKRWDELDVEMTGGVRGQAIPTLIALRQQIAMAFAALDKLEEADREFAKLYKLGQEQLELSGRTDRARTNLARVGLAWAPVRSRLAADPEAANALLNSSIDLVRETLRHPGSSPDAASDHNTMNLLAALLQNLGVQHLNQGQITEAAAYFQESVDIMANILANIRTESGFAELDDNQKDTKTASLQINHDKMAIGLAYVQLRLGQTDESMALFSTAIQARREIFDRRPGMLALKLELAGYLSLVGKSMLWIDRPDEAEPLLRESIVLFEEICATDAAQAAHRRQLSTALYWSGTLLDIRGDAAGAAAAFERSQQLREELYSASPDEKNAINLMLAEARVGRMAAARKLIDELGTSPNTSGERHLERARALTQLSRHAEGDQQIALRTEALAALDRAIKEGYSDPFRMRHERDLDPLHDMPRFEETVAQLQTAQQAASPSP